MTLDGRNIDWQSKHLQADYTPEFTAIAFENQSYPELRHRRQFALFAGKYLLLIDEATGPAAGLTAIHFQTAPGAPIRVDQTTCEVRTAFAEGANLAFVPLPQPGLKVIEEPGLKANTGVKTPRPAFRYELTKNDSAPVHFVTALIPVPDTSFPEIKVESVGENRYRLKVGDEVFEVDANPGTGLLSRQNN